jgi:NTP pyrophosphatase (non-canonical NTP hydrolase)
MRGGFWTKLAGGSLMEFNDSSKVNLERANAWHKLGIEEWSLSDWAVAMVGEAGEACNQIKKFNRLRVRLQSNNPDGFDMTKLAEELADTFIYLDILATRCGLNLETIVRAKFNAISERENLPQRV